MSDEVIEKLWRIKDEMAREYGYDVARLAADLQGRLRGGGTSNRGLARPAGGSGTRGVGERWSLGDEPPLRT